MKKKLFLTVVMTLVFAVALMLAVSAESVHNENTVDYDETVTLSDGKVLPLFDENNDALIWYIDGKDESGKNTYASILSEDSQVKWYTENWGEVTGVGINFDDGTKVEGKNIVVVNMMDDDIVTNYGPGTSHYGKHITGFKYVFRNWSNLEYVYLRLDTTGIFKESFNNCPKLKYINLEDLTKLERIGDNYNFSSCTSLFEGQVLDLSNSKLWSIDWNNSFTGVPMIGIKLPSTMTRLGDSFKNTALISFTYPEKVTGINTNMFYGCADLEVVTLSKGITGTIGKDAFFGCSSLTTVYYVGTLDELNALLDRTESGNDAFLAVAGENRENLISYADYKNLKDKSGKYMVYNYSWCEAYNDGLHEITNPTNACVGVCDVCKDAIVNHAQDATVSTAMVYADYTLAGEKVTTCQNAGCTYRVTEDVPALFVNLGYSAAEYDGAQISVNYKVNAQAVKDYEDVMGVALNYGVFAVLAEKIGTNDIFDAEGKALAGVISADITDSGYTLFNLKITGFTNEQKDIDLAMGAYVGTTKDEKTTYSYLQIAAPTNGKYYCASYNDVKAIVDAKNGVSAQ